MIVNAKPERLGVFGNVDLTGYAKTSDLQAVEQKLITEYTPLNVFNSTIGSLTDIGNTPTEGESTNIVNEINKIYERLTWKELTE